KLIGGGVRIRLECTEGITRADGDVQRSAADGKVCGIQAIRGVKPGCGQVVPCTVESEDNRLNGCIRRRSHQRDERASQNTLHASLLSTAAGDRSPANRYVCNGFTTRQLCNLTSAVP